MEIESALRILGGQMLNTTASIAKVLYIHTHLYPVLYGLRNTYDNTMKMKSYDQYFVHLYFFQIRIELYRS